MKTCDLHQGVVRGPGVRVGDNIKAARRKVF